MPRSQRMETTESMGPSLDAYLPWGEKLWLNGLDPGNHYIGVLLTNGNLFAAGLPMIEHGRNYKVYQAFLIHDFSGDELPSILDS